jgi:hypothetical protein
MGEPHQQKGKRQGQRQRPEQGPARVKQDFGGPFRHAAAMSSISGMIAKHTGELTDLP